MYVPNKSSHPRIKSDLYNMHALCLKCKSMSMEEEEFLKQRRYYTTNNVNCDLTIKIIFADDYKISTYSSDETVCSAMVSSGMYIWWTQSGMHSHFNPGLSFVKNDV